MNRSVFSLFSVSLGEEVFDREEQSHDTHVTGVFRRVTNETQACFRTQQERQIRVQMFPQDQTPVLFCRSFSISLFTLNELAQTKELCTNHDCCIRHPYLSW